jgi:GH25 family lysozyme M1 (1,4-beta-N-acetylmuramidase)
MARICPECGGREVGCSMCFLPPKRKLPKDNLLKRAIYKLQSSLTWEVQGVDISSWNGIMDFNITKSKCQYAFVRAGYGNEWKDYRSDTYRQDLNAVDMPHGLYWYCYIGQNWLKHAQNFAEVAALYPYQMDLVIDAETTTLNPVDTFNWLVNMDEKLFDLTGKHPMIYTSMGFWNDHVARNTYFCGSYLWDAHWTTANAPLIPYEWKNCIPQYIHWQHSADGNNKAKEYGMVKDGDPDMDLDRYYNTLESFNLRYKTDVEPVQPVIPIKPIKYVYINATALNMRSIPGDITPPTDIGTIKMNDDVPVVEERNGWYRIEGWISKAYTRPK